MMSGTWLSMEVAAELALAASPPLKLPVEAIALLSAVIEARSFRSLYGDSAASPRLWEGSLDAFPPLDQIGAVGPTGQPTHTFGAWQWEPKTADDIAVGIGTPSVTPENQIRGSWWLAQRDYKTHGRADLLADLGAAGHDVAALDAIAARLHPTWPGGARPGFSDRYLAALVGPVAPAPMILLHYGEVRLVALDGWDNAGAMEPLPQSGGVVTVDDDMVCTAALSADGQWVTVTWRGPGKTIVHYALAALRADLEVNVATLTKISFNPDRPFPASPAG